MADAKNDPALPPVPSVEVGELLGRLDRGDDLLLLDVRNDEEFEGWKLEARSAVPTVHVPYFDFIEDTDGSIAKLPRGRDVVVLCAQGGSSEMIVDMLGEAGIASKNVKGGMLAYGAYLEPVRVPLPPDAARGLELWQVNRRGKGCLSYLVLSGGEAVVVDPSRHVEWYEAFLAERGARLVQVLDTHVHADHLSGGPALARRSGAPYFVAGGEGFELTQPVTPLVDGQVLRVGGPGGVAIELRALATPGHTPGSTCYLVDGRLLLSGDTLFVAGVGRPDLGGHVEEWGRALFHTLKVRLSELADATVVLPAHYSSVAEIGADGVVSGRLGTLRRSVPELQVGSAEEFVRGVRGSISEPPKAYADIIRANLGAQVTPEQASEWELGKNQCAAASRKGVA